MAHEKTPAEEESTPEVDVRDENSEAAAPVADSTETSGAQTQDADEGEAQDYDEAGAATEDEASDEAKAPRTPMSHVKLALIAGLMGVLALAGLTGWLGYRAYESQQAEQQRNLFLQVGRQGALNLTTIDHETAEQDVQRILDSATGTFYDDFQQRAQPFVDVVKQAQSTSEGTIAEAGLETYSENEGTVLVAVTVRTSNAGAPEQQPRAWRMRVTVQEVDGEAKVSKVDFVP
ncbi:Mce protein [Mycolicibacterium duvalii]|uniref:Uncharacterized protein n=1 Tax=Mycolicibacterium duvalii TaxID=39688 RepID=A0A7I7JW11_9MYCO|nr:tetratricopeptide repeat protein [Mycolicibacterium duvalii]MCV7368567.1 tetratricopeptide repeat protein [Mycolicibacterium duvalii]PEG39681.1 Mce protein [Mycolicibacterium duvalii]BBX15262.1 hypothetical protein MDUV_01220 [Mycolicibacterium duvalii]